MCSQEVPSLCQKRITCCINTCHNLSWYLENPGKIHWCVDEHLLGFLIYDPEPEAKNVALNGIACAGCSGCSFDNNHDTRNSRSTYLGTIGGGVCLSTVSWMAKSWTQYQVPSSNMSLWARMQRSLLLLQNCLMQLILWSLQAISQLTRLKWFLFLKSNRYVAEQSV